jgi:hypothetical protein
MRSQDQSSSSNFGYVDLESRFPAKDWVRLMREMLGATSHAARNTDDTGKVRQESAIAPRESCGPFGRLWGPAL